MTMYLIPVQDTEPFFDQVTDLDGVQYELSFRYNQREQQYYLSIGTPEGVALVKGAAVLCNWSIFDRSMVGMPQGYLIVIPQGNDTSPPKLGELGPGKRCELLYFTADELLPATVGH